MSSKIVLTIDHSDPKHPNSLSMAQTIGLLAHLIDLPSGGVKLTINCEDEDMASYLEDLHATLARRPVGINVKVKTETEDTIERSTMASVTPMDKAWSN